MFSFPSRLVCIFSDRAWVFLFSQVPRMLIEHKHHKKTWKRKEIGIRLPDAPVLLDLLQQLDG